MESRPHIRSGFAPSAGRRERNFWLQRQSARIRHAKPLNNKYRWWGEQLHDLILFMSNTGLRPDKALRLEYRDVTVAYDEGSSETILEIEVRGNHWVSVALPCLEWAQRAAFADS